MYDSKWVYGYFGKDYSERCIISNYLNASNEAWEVIPETVGQFTGLLDKNGKEIYEGDILQLKSPISKELYNVVVEFKEGSFGTVGDVTGALIPFIESYLTTEIVIGNIHDNPELLIGGEE